MHVRTKDLIKADKWDEAMVQFKFIREQNDDAAIVTVHLIQELMQESRIRY